MAKLPGSVDVTAQYDEGTGTLLNAAVLQAGDFGNVIASDVPVSVGRHIYVSETAGDNAVAHGDITVSAPGGVSLPSNHTCALDRRTMDAGGTVAGVEAEQHAGLTIGLPLYPDAAEEFSLYDSATKTTVPLTYVDSGTVSGRDVLNYTAQAQGSLQDPAILEALPPALPKSQLAGLAPLLPADLQAKLGPGTRDAARSGSVQLDRRLEGVAVGGPDAGHTNRRGIESTGDRERGGRRPERESDPGARVGHKTD
ncbi:porin PorA family protein [Rhodococcus opacus]|uniref:porin PorA family protein n=1 Tax=Rhodococcus opacus TaxID=37919 RepID=UPI00294A83C8|nr:porin PorA family protein [Rhodococcus opacus]MDV6247498.1 porin PorA family protein [Rhodococcus opacus]